MRELLAAILSVSAIGAVVVARNGSAPRTSGLTARGLVASVHYGRDNGVVWREAQRMAKAHEFKCFDDIEKFLEESHAVCRKQEYKPFNQIFKDTAGPKWDDDKVAEAAGKVAQEFEQ